MNRRDFLKNAFAGGALMATAKLPSLADAPEEFPRRGQWERLAVSIVNFHVGAAKPFNVLHVSDTHLTDAYPHEPKIKQELKSMRTRTFGGRQEEALRDTLEYARLHAEYLVHTGDLIDFQSEKNFDLVRQYFGGAQPTQVAMGNHEFSINMWLGKGEDVETRDAAHRAKSADKLSAAYPQAIDFASQIVNGVNFITFDDVYGDVTEAQVAKFKAEVEKGLPIILCMHVPFHSEKSWQLTRMYWNAGRTAYDAKPAPIREDGDYDRQLKDPVTRDFIKYLKSEKLLKGILTGHEHFHYQERFSPTCIQVIAPGNYSFAANLVAID